ncbi:HD-GYP domain-containing protein [Paenibacillus polymyxa]|uniref:HD-GYP domain-containing protein n=1 Tax=Paenibacillus polymyxa TaxID=1406 RepID=UPI0032B01663
MIYSHVLDQLDRRHAERVSDFSLALARCAGLLESECQRIAGAALYHDIGKIAMPSSILNSAAPLTAQQRDHMQKHVEYGLSLLSVYDSEDMRAAKEVISTHHERWDGSGYPKGLVGEEIPLSGRIVAISDVFDALMFSRPYKPAWGIRRAVQFIKDQAGKDFDPGLIGAFQRAVASVFGKDVGLHYTEQSIDKQGYSSKGLLDSSPFSYT